MLTCALDERRWLKLLEDGDAEELYAAISANRPYLSRWMPWAVNQDLEGTREYIRSTRRGFADNQGFSLAIVDAGAIVGTTGFHRLDWENMSCSVGYWITESAQGRGTVTLAVTALLGHAFGAWGLRRVEIRAGVGNARSRAVAERLGFTEEGVRRQAELVGDRYVDHVIYSMLAAEWERRADRPARSFQHRDKSEQVSSG